MFGFKPWQTVSILSTPVPLCTPEMDAAMHMDFFFVFRPVHQLHDHFLVCYCTIYTSVSAFWACHRHAFLLCWDKEFIPCCSELAKQAMALMDGTAHSSSRADSHRRADGSAQLLSLSQASVGVLSGHGDALLGRITPPHSPQCQRSCHND